MRNRKSHKYFSDDRDRRSRPCAREPQEVSRSTWAFAGPTIATESRLREPLGSPGDRVAHVCRLPDDAEAVLCKPMKGVLVLQAHNTFELSTVPFTFPCD